MGCKSSAPLKEETVVAPVTAVTKVATPVAASPVKVKEASPVREEPVPHAAEEDEAPAAAIEATVLVEVAAGDAVVEAPVEEPVAAPEPAKVEVTPVAAVPAAEKPAKKSSKKKSSAKKEKKTATTAKATPAVVATGNDENAVPSAVKKVVTTEKRVAFAPRANTNIVAAPKQPVAAKKSGKGGKKHQNVEDAKVKEMTMAFQRMLTHADHLEYHLSNKNTYNKA